MKKIYNLFLVMIALVLCTSCNDEWKSEQYVHLVSVKSPLNSQGVTPIYVRYKSEGEANYKLPLIVSGTLQNNKDLNIHFGIDADTLEVLNEERFGSRTELYYKLLGPQFYNFAESVTIPAGESQSLLPISFTLDGLDMTDKWLLPVEVLSDPSYNYDANPRKHYRKALLRIYPFNDYSGVYSATAYKVYMDPGKTNAITTEYQTGYVVDENTLFFYAGLVDEDRLDRKHYKIFVEFTDEPVSEYDPTVKKLRIYTDNEDIKLKVNGTPSYYVEEEMDDVLPYMKYILTYIDFSYDFEDYTTSPGTIFNYYVDGKLTLKRNINTQIPDEDQAIEW